MLLSLPDQLLLICLDPGIKDYGVGRPLPDNISGINIYTKAFSGGINSSNQDI